MSDAPTRVRRYLEVLLVQQRADDDGGLGEHASDILGVFTDLRVLTAAQADEWRARLERARNDDRSVDSATRSRAAAHLNGLLDRARSEGGYDFQRLQPYYTASSALQSLGALSQEEFMRRHREAAPVTGIPQPPPGPPPKLPPHFAATELDAVVPGPHHLGNGVHVVSLELYADCCAVVWHRVVTAESDAEASQPKTWRRNEQAPEFELRDELGTTYHSAGGGWHGGTAGKGPYVMSGHAIFVPAPPSGAAWVEVLTGHSSARFAVPPRT